LKQIISDVGARPWGIGINDGGTTLYTANGPSGDVSIVDIASGATQAKIQVGGSPWGIATSRSSR
jgi:YVTN family beta-propeller protein